MVAAELQIQKRRQVARGARLDKQDDTKKPDAPKSNTQKPDARRLDAQSAQLDPKKLSEAKNLPDTISISLITKEVITIRLQRFPSELRFTVAANSDVSKATIEHASRVLETLQNISTIYHASRNPQDGSRLPKIAEFSLPVQLQNMVSSWKIAIYQFSLAKFKQRVRKQYKSTSRLDFFTSIMKSLPDNTDDSI